MIVIKSAEFLTAAARPNNLPPEGLPEVALIGRSNSGKSTLINRLCNRKKLAVTSAVPGRTRQLNFFGVEVRPDKEASRELILVDLPGYGYAKYGKSSASKLDELVAGYITRRESLKVICLLNDARRTPQQEELAIQRLAFERGLQMVVVVTKIDKLNRREKEKGLAAIAKEYHLEKFDLEISGKNEDLGPLWRRILALVC
ncbi:MAG: ribosome biogenesis GTP-binding protein YsxC [Deltaproteobacteria bacterium]|nr:ribosome biogenesis GTP-binding protein YsxC [Deltaproteobacteria bacterium]